MNCGDARRRRDRPRCHRDRVFAIRALDLVNVRVDPFQATNPSACAPTTNPSAGREPPRVGRGCRTKSVRSGRSIGRGSPEVSPQQGKNARPCGILFPRRSKVPKKTPVVSPYPLLDEPDVIVLPEDVQGIPDDMLAVRRKRARRLVRELIDKSALDLSLASNVLALGNDNPPPYRAIVEKPPVWP
jgi:hypothetical protein